jgi:hypothetical protein
MAVGENFRSSDVLQGEPLGMISTQVLLTADNTVIDPAGKSLIYVGSDNTTASNRTFTVLPNGLQGYLLTLCFYTGSSTTAELADSGTMRLQAAWTPTQYDTLVLMSDGTNWLEVCRGPGSVATGAIGASQLASDAVTAAKIAADAVTTVKILDANVTAAKLATDSVTAAKIEADAVTTAKILDANVTLAKLATGITPSHVAKYGAKFTTVGGAAAEAITVTGLAATDLVFVMLENDGTNNVSILSAVPTLNTLTVTFSADPGNDAIINYVCFRAAA